MNFLCGGGRYHGFISVDINFKIGNLELAFPKERNIPVKKPGPLVIHSYWIVETWRSTAETRWYLSRCSEAPRLKCFDSSPKCGEWLGGGKSTISHDDENDDNLLLVKQGLNPPPLNGSKNDVLIIHRHACVPPSCPHKEMFLWVRVSILRKCENAHKLENWRHRGNR